MLFLFSLSEKPERNVVVVNAKQRKFCLEYAKTGNATESAKKAGYSQKTAYSLGQRLLKNVEVQKELQKITEKLEASKIAQAGEMQSILTSIIRQELEEEVIVVEGCGDGVSEAVTKKKKASMNDIVKAINQLARMQGVGNDSANINVIVPVFGGDDSLED